MEQAGGFLKWLTDYLFELLFALSYGFVLYTIYFKRNSSYKRWALDETKDGYQTKNLFIRFMKIHGKWDFLIYYIYFLIVALLSLIPLLFAAEYCVAFIFAVRHWDKNRLHR